MANKGRPLQILPQYSSAQNAGIFLFRSVRSKLDGLIGKHILEGNNFLERNLPGLVAAVDVAAVSAAVDVVAVVAAAANLAVKTIALLLLLRRHLSRSQVPNFVRYVFRSGTRVDMLCTRLTSAQVRRGMTTPFKIKQS